MDIVEKKDFRMRGLSVAVTMTQRGGSTRDDDNAVNGDDATRYKLEWMVRMVRKQVMNATAI